ncbi:MAG: peroxiredoxin [Candidatus Micrarchaeota archaeon]|nr:peroxiredoxin [Candidatus Micrarchaeota archaeon]
MSCFTAHTGEKVCLDKGLVVLYVYPKDNTPGCTVEAQEFNQLLPEFERLGVKVVGLSKDSLESHKRFAQKLGLRFPLISSEDLIKELGAWGKKAFGREGTIRSTFVFKDGQLIQSWKNVRARGHAQKVLEWVREWTSSH